MEFWIKFSTIFFLTILQCLLPTQQQNQEKTDVRCFDLEQQSVEIALNCSTLGLVSIITARYGYQELALDRGLSETCAYQTTAGPCDAEPRDDTLQMMYARCQGRPSCSVNVPPIELAGCAPRRSNFFQVNYVCITGVNSNKKTVIDICEDEFVRRSSGYIKSPNYPSDYHPTLSCACQLSTASPGIILLDLLDVDISPGDDVKKTTDWLEYTVRRDDWGDGVRLSYRDKSERISINSSKVFLNFKTDFRQEARGFWLGYQGRSLDKSEDVAVNLTCGHYSPPGYMNTSTCFDPGHAGEVYLSCHSAGVINILSSRHGYTYDVPCSPDTLRTASSDSLCEENDEDDVLNAIKDKCMGERACAAPVTAVRLPACDKESNYIQVDYSCIPDDQDRSLIDVCGDSLWQNRAIQKYSGYIQSLGYPDKYPLDVNCSCRLFALVQEASIIITMIDVDLADDTCQVDSLEFVTGPQRVGHGEKLCGRAGAGAINTSAKTIYLNFYADDENAKRGFWLKYRGIGPDQSRAPVLVQCWPNLPGMNIPEQPSITTSSKPPPDNQQPVTSSDGTAEVSEKNSNKHHRNRVGLIACLSVAVLLIMIVLVGMVIHRYRSSSGKAPAGRYEDSATTSSLDKNQPTTNYSAFSSPGRPPYAQFDSGQSRGPSASNSQPNTVIITNPSNRHGPHFTNEAFEGDVEVRYNIPL